VMCSDKEKNCTLIADYESSDIVIYIKL